VLGVAGGEAGLEGDLEFIAQSCVFDFTTVATPAVSASSRSARPAWWRMRRSGERLVTVCATRTSASSAAFPIRNRSAETV